MTIRLKSFFVFISFLFLFFSFLCFPGLMQAQVEKGSAEEETLEVRVVSVLEEKEIKVMDKSQLYQKLEAVVTSGSLKGKKIVLENGHLPMSNIEHYKKGDGLLVVYTKDMNGENLFYITDFIRRNALFWLLFIFVVLTLLVARWQGLASLLGMLASFAIIFFLILPQINAGKDPVLMAVLGSFLIIPFTFYLSHGLNKKTTIAILGTCISLIVTGFLAIFFVNSARLTGYASEEASFLQAARQGSFNVKGLLLAGIIIGVLGILDDITISQSAVVAQLKKSRPKIKADELFSQAMAVGKDHISSMINTLILVYAGASLPLLLLFVDSPHPVSEIINYEIVADEIVRTLAGSIGLVLAVPVTTLIAALVFSKKKD
jgi:uncharacterized membrane protein